MWTQLVQAYMLASWIPAQAQPTQIQFRPQLQFKIIMMSHSLDHPK